MIDWEKELTEFLKKHEAYDKFLVNIKQAPTGVPIGSVARLHFHQLALCAAFPWPSTPEGSLFWSPLSDKWEAHCKEIAKQDTSPESK